MKRTGYTVAAAVTALVVAALLTSVPCISNASGKIHIVVKGDTLWDISSFYIYDPFQWPQIWSANRDIENPHLIYPGQEILIPDMRARVAPVPGAAQPALPAPDPGSTADAAVEPAPQPEPEPEPVPEPAEITEEVKQEMLLAMSTFGFIIDDSEIGLGTITSTEEKRLLISPGMKVYVESESGRPLRTDRRYSIVRVYDKIKHPVTREEVGHLAKVLGDMDVVHFRRKLSTGIVGEVYKDIQIGDHVIEHIDYMTWIPVQESALAAGLTGYIILNPEGSSIMGKGNVVFIDLGIEDGLRTGDIFDLLGKEKQVGGEDTPPEIIGQIQVIVPRPGSSVARITSSQKEITLGTRVVSSAR